MLILHAFLLATTQTTPPPVPREFRAAWVATVANIDWPSKKGLPPSQQRSELVRIFDTARQMKLNAIVLQIRPAADALYESRLEPWSEYLTGQQGQPPEPRYDPLSFAVDEAHLRGLELHVWFNPYRAKHPTATSPIHESHSYRTNPRDVKVYGKHLWMDPGSKWVQQRSLDVITDVVRRYDIDGVHIDDYFYPYPEGGQDFPDGESYAAYLRQGGTLGRADWRRKNVDDFVQALYKRIKDTKRWVKFGISPFGIYRPDVPTGIKAGIDQYAQLYADARKWLVEGWCDYYSPQLYWPIAQKPQSYPVLLEWWLAQNPKGRHLWPGNFTSRTNPAEGNWKPKEVLEQIRLTRSMGAGGNIHFSMKAFMNDWNGVRESIRGIYSQDALPPASPWLDSVPPAAPTIARHEGNTFSWAQKGKEEARWWVVWRKYGTVWVTRTFPAVETKMSTAMSIPSGNLSAFGVAAVDRNGNASSTAWANLD